MIPRTSPAGTGEPARDEPAAHPPPFLPSVAGPESSDNASDSNRSVPGETSATQCDWALHQKPAAHSAHRPPHPFSPHQPGGQDATHAPSSAPGSSAARSWDGPGSSIASGVGSTGAGTQLPDASQDPPSAQSPQDTLQPSVPHSLPLHAGVQAPGQAIGKLPEGSAPE